MNNDESIGVALHSAKRGQDVYLALGYKTKPKVAIVTGASKGIGLAIKKELEKEGILVFDWSRTSGIDLMDGIKLQDYQLLRDADILINNVGGMGTCKAEDAQDCMFKNYGIMQKLTDIFISNKTKTWGRVITISSLYGKEKGPNPYFVAAKAAQIGFMKSISLYYPGITFNTVCPGMIDTGKFTEEQLKKHIVGQPEDVAHLVSFLCSDKAKHINGATIVIDGGESHGF